MKVETPDLFGEAHARWSDPDTSKAAAEDLAGEKATRLEYVVLATLQNFPQGLTMHEIVRLTGLPWNTVSPRIRPLVRKGFVIDSGKRRKGPTGHSCIVWRAT